MTVSTTTRGRRGLSGWFVLGLSLTLLLGVALLKGGADEGGELD